MKLISFFIFYLSVSVLCAGRYVDSTPFSEAAMNEIRGENPVAKAACYVQDAGEKRYHGSGVFVQYESNTFVITAAHNGELNWVDFFVKSEEVESKEGIKILRFDVDSSHSKQDSSKKVKSCGDDVQILLLKQDPRTFGIHPLQLGIDFAEGVPVRCMGMVSTSEKSVTVL